MGGLLDGLSISRSAINAARAGVQLTGHNISNADTEGYHRQRIETSAVTPPLSGAGMPIIGGGVEVTGAYRTEDRLLAKQVNTSMGHESYSATRETYMLEIEAAVGKIGEGGLGAVISDLMTQFSALSTAPDDLTVRNQVIASADNLAVTFNRIATTMGRVVDGAHAEVQSVINEINSRSTAIAELNAQIVQAESNGQEASDLRDRRDLLVQELAQRAGSTSFEDANGRVTVLLAGHALVQEAQHLTLQATQLTDGRSQIQLVQGSGNLDITSSVVNGKVGGLLSIQQTVVQQVMADVDQLAYDLATQINTQHQAGFDLNGNPGGDFFVAPLSPGGAAAAMSVQTGLAPEDLAASSTTTGAPGNNQNALLLAGLGRQLLAGGGNATFADQAASIVGSVGTLTDQAMQASAVAKDELSYLETLQQSSDGVSLDEEMIQLIQYQRSYQAGVKVLHVIDGLLERLIAL